MGETIHFRSFLRVVRPYALIALLPFAVLWRLWTWNAFDRAFIWQDVTESVYHGLLFLVDSIVRFREVPLWAWGIYSGTPFDASFFNFVMYPPHWLFFARLADPGSAAVFHVLLVAHLAAAGVGVMLLARSFRFSRGIAVLGACVYVFSGFTTYVFAIGEAWFMFAAWMPFVLWSTRRFVQTRRGLWLVAVGGFWYLLMSALMPLLMAPFVYVFAAFVAVTIVKEGRTRAAGPLIVAIAVAIGLASAVHAAQLLPLFEISRAGQGYQLSEYLYARDKWGEQGIGRFVSEFFFAGDLAKPYPGALAGIGILFALFRPRGRYWSWWAGLFGVLVAVCFLRRDVFLYGVVYWLPMVGKLPAIDRGLGGVYALAAAFLAMSGFRHVQGVLRLRKGSTFGWRAALICGALAAVLWTALRPAEGAAFFAFRRAFLLWLVTLAAAGSVMTAVRRRRGRTVGVLLLGAIVVVDCASGFMRAFEPRLLPRAEIEKGFLAQSPYVAGRVAPPKLPSVLQGRIELVRGMTSLVVGPDNVAGYYAWHFARTVQAFSAAGFSDPYMFQGPKSPAFDAELRWPARVVHQLFDIGDGRLGRAWIVPDGKVIDSSPLRVLAQPDFDGARTAYLEPELDVVAREFGSRHLRLVMELGRLVPKSRPLPPATPIGRVSEGVWLLRQTPNTIAFRVNHAGTLVFSDAWYPGWAVYVDGRRAPLYVADYNFKGVQLAGPASVEFVFAPPLVSVGRAISLVAALAFLLGAVLTRRASIGRPS